MLRLPLVLLLSSAMPLLAEGVALPEGFAGLYAPEGIACGSDLTIRVEGGAMIGGDGAMVVSDLIELPGTPKRVDVTLIVSGGGEDWTEQAVITRAEDGQSLHLRFADGMENRWTRCD